MVVKTNVTNSIDEIRAWSPVLQNMDSPGKIKIVGGYYSLTDGSVQIINN